MHIKERLKRVKFLTIRPDLSGMINSELMALKSAVRAARKMTDVFLDQMGLGNRELFERLSRGGSADRDLFRFMQVHGCPWDDSDHDAPFIEGIGPRPPGAGVYPADMTKEEWDAAIASADEAQRDALQSPYTVIVRDDSVLRAVPYSEAYREHLAEAAEDLRTSAALIPRGPLNQFLHSRADAFGHNDYDPSDRLWIGTDGSPFEVTIGPYEVYFDQLAGLKASFEAFIGIPDRQANEALSKFGPAVPSVDAMLAERYGFKSSGGARPLEVVSDVYRGGEAAFGIVFVAYNLPNNRLIRTEVGSKNVFSATLMQAKFDHLTLPVAERMVSAETLSMLSFEARLLFVLAHELAHGIGPSTVVIDGRPVSFEKTLGPLHSAIEEAKADMLGMLLMDDFARRGLLTDEQVAAAVVTDVATYPVAWRNGFTEAHALGHVMQYNWMAERGAAGLDRPTRRIWIDADKARVAMIELAHEFIGLQLTGERSKAEQFVDRWGTPPDGIAEILTQLTDIPAKVHPVFDI